MCVYVMYVSVTKLEATNLIFMSNLRRYIVSCRHLYNCMDFTEMFCSGDIMPLLSCQDDWQFDLFSTKNKSNGSRHD